MRSRNSLRTSILLAAGILFVTASLIPATTQEKPVYKANGTEATVVGTISFAGTPPERFKIDTSADPVCGKVNPNLMIEWLVVTDHKLANVFVYLRSETLNLYSFDAPAAEVTLEHKDCRYVPHVFGMQTQQTLKILNSDPTVHNTHPTPRDNPEWNQSQPPGAAPLEHRFARPELFIPIKDNQHPWEKSYVGVFTHPFFAVSSLDGSFRISGVPPGQYTLVAWHERLGEKTVDVFLGSGEQKQLDFTFKADDR